MRVPAGDLFAGNDKLGSIAMAYEAPSIKAVGSVADLTLAQGVSGNDDVLLWFIRYGTEVS